MIRRLYQITLVALQVALLVQIAPPLAQSLWRGVALGAFPARPAGADPGRKRRRCDRRAARWRSRFRLSRSFVIASAASSRFGGVPRWSVALALAGTASSCWACC